MSVFSVLECWTAVIGQKIVCSCIPFWDSMTWSSRMSHTSRREYVLRCRWRARAIQHLIRVHHMRTALAPPRLFLPLVTTLLCHIRLWSKSTRCTCPSWQGRARTGAFPMPQRHTGQLIPHLYGVLHLPIPGRSRTHTVLPSPRSPCHPQTAAFMVSEYSQMSLA